MSSENSHMYQETSPHGELPRADIQALTDFLLDYAISQIAAGAYTSRVVKNVQRIGESYGYSVDMLILQRNLTMTVTCQEDYSCRRTYVRKQAHTIHFSFRTISALSALSWRAYDLNVSLDELKKEYFDIIHAKHEDWRLLLFLTGLATMAFCKLFGGDTVSMGVVFVAAICGFMVRRFLTSFNVDMRLSIVGAATVSSFVALTGSNLLANFTSTADIAIATSVLYLVPGAHFINAVIDILDGHVLIGISRGVNTLILVLCMSVGMYFTLMLSGGF